MSARIAHFAQKRWIAYSRRFDRHKWILLFSHYSCFSFGNGTMLAFLE
jgi:hypothetical protein